MRYTGLLVAVLAVLCLTCACENQDSNKEYNTVATQTGAQYHSSWMTGIAKADACQNAAIADWLELCAAPERDDIGHYILHNKVHNQDNTFTHHLLLYRSATAKDAAHFTVDFSLNGDTLTVTPTYTSADTSVYGYDLIYVSFVTEKDLEISVELLVDGDYPGAIQSTTPYSITPDTFEKQTHA